jgi:hypothetical protein
MYEEFIGDIKSDLDFEVKVTVHHGGLKWLITQ